MSHKETRNHRVKCDFGITDYFKYYKKKSKNPKSSKLYKNLLKDWLEANQELISQEGYMFTLPARMGRIELRKVKREVKLEGNKIVNNLAINWKKTKELWKENEKAKEKKILVRHTNEHTDGYIYRIIYVKYTANYKNKTIYKMQLNREMRRNTQQPIENNKLDAFLLIPER